MANMDENKRGIKEKAKGRGEMGIGLVW